MLAGAMLWPKVVQFRLDKAQSQSVQLNTLNNIVATFDTKNYGNLVAGTAIVGVANPYAPTIAELRNWGLPSNFSAVNAYGGTPNGYGVVISKLPAACTPPNCDLSALVYLTTPILNPMTGRMDGAALGRAVEALGADAGFSTQQNPGTITGVNGAWTAPNPLGNVAGILAMRSGYGSSGMAQFMRRDGTLPATGAQDMGGQDVNNVNKLSSTTLANSGNASVGGALGVAGQTTTAGISNNGAIDTITANVSGALTAGSATVNGPATVNGSLAAGTLTAGNTTINGNATVNGAASVTSTLGVGGAATLASSLSVAGTTVTNGLTNNGKLTNTGDVQTGRLYLTTVVTAGTSCAGYSGYQAATSTGQIASCVSGTWAAYTQAPPPSPCNSTTVSWQGCTGTVPYTQSGNTAGVTVTAGTGSATYACNNGTWAFQSGSCTPPPAGCNAQTVYWSGSASCSGSITSMTSGAGKWVNSSNANNGSVYVTCNNGSINQTSPSCSRPSRTFFNPTASNSAYLASNPGLRSQFCSNNGYSSAVGFSQSDSAGSNVQVCWTIDGNNNCLGGDNCVNYAYGNPGCYVQTSITCQ